MLAASVAVFGLTASASAQSQAREHVFVGFKNTPGPAERALVERHGGNVRLAFPSVNALAIDLAGEKVGALARESGVQYVEEDPVREPLGLADAQLTPSLQNGL